MSGATLYRPGGKIRNGFTLTELLVVLSVVSIMSAIAAPSVAGWVQNYRTQTAARQLMTDLQFARMSAVSQKANWQVTIDSGKNQYTVGAGITRQMSVQSPGVKLGTSPATGTWTVTFDPLGDATFDRANTMATLTQGTVQWTVTVTGTGSISIGGAANGKGAKFVL